jgi:hypothetical protein
MWPLTGSSAVRVPFITDYDGISGNHPTNSSVVRLTFNLTR